MTFDLYCGSYIRMPGSFQLCESSFKLPAPNDSRSSQTVSGMAHRTAGEDGDAALGERR